MAHVPASVAALPMGAAAGSMWRRRSRGHGTVRRTSTRPQDGAREGVEMMRGGGVVGFYVNEDIGGGGCHGSLLNATWGSGITSPFL